MPGAVATSLIASRHEKRLRPLLCAALALGASLAGGCSARTLAPAPPSGATYAYDPGQGAAAPVLEPGASPWRLYQATFGFRDPPAPADADPIGDSIAPGAGRFRFNPHLGAQGAPLGSKGEAPRPPP